jgi:hypothetical protein
MSQNIELFFNELLRSYSIGEGRKAARWRRGKNKLIERGFYYADIVTLFTARQVYQ